MALEPATVRSSGGDRSSLGGPQLSIAAGWVLIQCRILDNLLDSQPYHHKTKLLSVDDSGRPWRYRAWRARESVKSAIDCIPSRRSHAVQVWRNEMAHADRTGLCLSRGQNGTGG